MIRRRFVFYGRVQGVGFRWRALHAAQMYSCTGWVRNEWDGSVEMEVQGAEEAIAAVIRAISRGQYVQIDRMTVKNLPLDEEERNFRAE